MSDDHHFNIQEQQWHLGGQADHLLAYTCSKCQVTCIFDCKWGKYSYLTTMGVVHDVPPCTPLALAANGVSIGYPGVREALLKAENEGEKNLVDF